MEAELAKNRRYEIKKNDYDYFFLAFGERKMIIRFPSNFGICSKLAISAKRSANCKSSNSPRSLKTI